MTKGELERKLKKAGFAKENAAKHDIWRNGDISLTVSKGLGVPWFAQVRLNTVLRQVEKRDRQLKAQPA